jgi:hypothetical protein
MELQEDLGNVYFKIKCHFKKKCNTFDNYNAAYKYLICTNLVWPLTHVSTKSCLKINCQSLPTLCLLMHTTPRLPANSSRWKWVVRFMLQLHYKERATASHWNGGRLGGITTGNFIYIYGGKEEDPSQMFIITRYFINCYLICYFWWNVNDKSC